MGRVVEFDRTDVLDRAAALFWRLGYEVVSVQDIESATGIGRGSLYNAFRDKETLFLEALDRYVELHGGAALAALEARRVESGIRKMFEIIIDRMANPANPRGCLLTNTSLAFGTGSVRIDQVLSERIKAMESGLEEAILRARQDRQIAADADPRSLARFYNAVAQSLGVIHKATGDVQRLRDIVTVAMQAWPRRRREHERTPSKRRS
jgi:TetR/AcrR family transcriptional regulator, transcriptional repressor for nem operon